MTIRLCALLATSVATLLAASPARADWESVHAPSDGIRDSNCSKPHNSPPSRGHVLKSENRPLRLRAGYSAYVEVFGHFIDDPRFKAAFAGEGRADASGIRRVAGAVNGARGCGNIGSFAVKVTLPPESDGGTTQLLIGVGPGDWHASIPIEIIPAKAVDTDFAPESLLGRSTVALPGGGAGGGAPGSPAPPLLTSGGQNGGCGPANPQGCQSGGGAVLPGGGAPRGGSTRRANLPDAIGGCIDNLGGRAEIRNLIATGKTLTLTLPRDRTSADAVACLRRPFFIVFDTEVATTDAWPGVDQNIGPDAIVASPPKYLIPPPGINRPITPPGEPHYRAFTFADGYLAGLRQSQTLVLRAIGGNRNAPDLSVVIQLP